MNKRGREAVWTRAIHTLDVGEELLADGLGDLGVLSVRCDVGNHFDWRKRSLILEKKTLRW